MMRLRNRRDPQGKFALTTPPNRDINNLPGFSPAEVNQRLQEIRRQADALAAPDVAALAQLALDATSTVANSAPTSAAPSQPDQDTAPPHSAPNPKNSAEPPIAPHLNVGAIAPTAPVLKNSASPPTSAPQPESAAGASVLEPKAGAQAPTSAPQLKVGAEASMLEPKAGAPAPTSARQLKVGAEASMLEPKASAPAPTSAPQLKAGAEAPTFTSRESRTLHAPFAHASAVASPEAASDAESAQTFKSRESHTPHVPFAHALAVDALDEVAAAAAPAAGGSQKNQDGAPAPTSAPQPENGAEAPSSKSRESHTLHVPFAHPPSAAAATESCATSASIHENEEQEEEDDDGVDDGNHDESFVHLTPNSSRERHARKCAVCSHPHRKLIEFDFVNWARPTDIVHNFNLPGSRTLRRHARATGLDAIRRRNVRSVLEIIMEDAAYDRPSSDAVIRAVRTFAHIADDGRWVNPPSHVIVSSGSQLNVANQLNLSIRPPGALDSQNGNPPIDVQSVGQPALANSISNGPIGD